MGLPSSLATSRLIQFNSILRPRLEEWLLPSTPHTQATPRSDSGSPVSGYHSGAGYSPDGVEPISPVSSPSLTHDKGLSKPLEEMEKSHLEGELRHKPPGDTRESSRWGN